MTTSNDSKYAAWLDTSDLESNLTERTIRAGKHTALAQGGRGIVDFAATLILARIITPEDFGLIGMVIIVTTFLELFKDMGLSMATVQRKEITHDQVSALFWINAGLGVLLAGVTAVSAPAVVWFYDKDVLLNVTLALAAAFAVGGLGVQHQALLTRQMYFGRRSIVELFSTIGSIAVAVVLGLLGYGYWALVAKFVVAPVLLTLGFWIACSWRPSWPRTSSGLGELVKFGGNLTGFTVVNYFARNADDILIGKFQGERVLGMYQEAYRILMVPLRQINAPIGAVAVPALSRLAEEPAKYRRAYTRLLEKVLLVTVPLGAFVIGCSDSLITVVLGPQWVEAGPILFWLGFMVLSQPIGNSTGWLFITQDRTADMFRWSLIGSTLSVASFVAGMPWGAVGVAAAYSVSGILLRTPILLWIVGRKGPIRTSDFYRAALAPGLAGGTSLVALLYLRTLNLGFSPAVEVVGGALLAYALAGVILAITPSGREAVRDTKRLVGEIRNKNFGESHD